ncbi:MAG: dethiobiotin synthetase [Candidatus Nitrosomirales archaeon]|jgi:dethiobiotin synthetase
MGGVFVTGTDTGVGKTVVAAGIAGSMRKDGIDVGVIKPIATGIPQEKGFKSSDAELLAKISGSKDPESEINPVFLPLEASPLAASRALNIDIKLDEVFSAFKRLTDKHDFVVVEGIGGVMVPIKQNYFVIDMIKEMGLPILIVSRAAIGTLNHTVLTVRACKEYDLNIAGIVLNGVRNDNVAEKTASAIIRELTEIFVIGSIPFVDVLDASNVIDLVSKYVKYDLLIS